METFEDKAEILRAALQQGASDIHLAEGQPVVFRRDGELLPWRKHALAKDAMEHLLGEFLTEGQRDMLAAGHDLDLSWQEGDCRFRINAYGQRGRPALAMRLLPPGIPSMEEIGAPDALYDLLFARHGLLIVSGKTGSGKSTTLAAFLQRLAQQRNVHIVSLEDPIERILPTPNGCFISQREMGRDFSSFAQALRSALREDPDIILIGEMRDAETMRIALHAAEAGFLVLTTLHTQSAPEAAMRIESMFPGSEQAQVRSQLALVLVGIIAQQLLPAVEGGRVCVAEVLLASDAVRNLIRAGKYPQLASAMLSGGKLGMQTRGQAMERLYREGKIAKETWQSHGEDAGRAVR